MGPVLPQIPFAKCPIRASLGSLGRKWALLVLRDVAFFRDMTFSQILRNKGGLIQRNVDSDDERVVHYQLTAKGHDIVPILTAFIQYGIRHHADSVFEDEKPRELERVFPGEQAFMLGRLSRYAQQGRAPKARVRARRT